MPSSFIIPDVTRDRPFTEADSIGHTTKYAERAFGVPLAEIGSVEMDGSRAALIVKIDGIYYRLHWARQSNGAIFWFTDGADRPLRIGPPARALADLRAALGG